MRRRIACDAGAASDLCRDVGRVLAARYGELPAMQGLELALSELLSNIVRHGRGTTGIALRLHLSAERAWFTLADDGEPFDMAAVPTRLPDNPRATGGRGLWLVRELTGGLRGRRWGRCSVHRVASWPV